MPNDGLLDDARRGRRASNLGMYRFSAKIISSSQGRNAIAAAAYRSAESFSDNLEGQQYDYSRRDGVISTAMFLPENAPEEYKSREILWNAVEAKEGRKDAQLAREVQLSLPHVLSVEENEKLVHEFVCQEFVDRGMIADVAIHAPDRSGDQRNIHAHIMLTTRVVTEDGFGKKARGWNDPNLLRNWRKAWGDQVNAALEVKGVEDRVSHCSYLDQGINREAQIKLGPVPLQWNAVAFRLIVETLTAIYLSETRSA